MKTATSYPVTRGIRIGRIRHDRCLIEFYITEGEAPADLSGKTLSLSFLSGSHVLLEKKPHLIDSNRVVFEVSEEEKERLYASEIGIVLRLDGVTIAEGAFEWGSMRGPVSKAPGRLEIDIKTD